MRRSPGTPLLFPTAYALHLSEEVWGGEGFVSWAARNLSPEFDETRFLIINAVAWPAMLAAALAATFFPAARWLTTTLATIVLVNGLLHLGSTIVTGTYSPGLATGTLLYLPIGGYWLRQAFLTGERVAPGVAIGLAIHAAVVLLVLSS